MISTVTVIGVLQHFQHKI